MAIGPASREKAHRIGTDLAYKRLTLNDIVRSYLMARLNQNTHINEIVRRI